MICFTGGDKFCQKQLDLIGAYMHDSAESVLVKDAA